MTDTKKLTQDATSARAAAIEACAATDDGGTANLDATFYLLSKGERAQTVVDAFKCAGLSASETRWLGRGVMVQPPGIGQGNKRYASNLALCRALSVAGWPVSPYYQMD